MSNQRPPARPWLLRLASLSRNTDPQPPPASGPAAPPPRVPLVGQGSLALGRTTQILPPQLTTPPPATLPPIPPPALSPPRLPTPPSATLPPTSPPVLLPRRLPTPPPTPPPRTLPPTSPPVLLPRRLPTPPPTPPPPTLPPTLPPSPAPLPSQPPVTISVTKPAMANGNGPATTPTIAEAPVRPVTARPTPPPSPVAATLTPLPTPPQTPKVIANPTAATENGSANINGTKVILSNGAAEPLKNRIDSFNKRNGDAKAPSPGSPTREDYKPPATGNGSGSNKKSTERGTRAITLAGRNIGAFMDLGAAYSHRIMKQQQQSFYSKTQPESEVKKSDAMSETHHHTAAESGCGGKKPCFSLVNSNVQSVNNSLLLGAACIHGSPGVHISVGGNHRRKNGADASTQKSPPPLH